jgi:hypothetical protein
MNNEFIPFEQALELKELGFDEPCIAFYEPDNNEVQVVGVEQRYNDPKLLRMKDFCAPLYQQVFRWFREKYCICSWVYQVDKNRYFFSQLKNGRFLVTKNSEYNTYEEAELECLNKLIELVKNK